MSVQTTSAPDWRSVRMREVPKPPSPPVTVKSLAMSVLVVVVGRTDYSPVL